MKPAVCRQTEEVLVERNAERDAILMASTQQHFQSCRACERHQRTWLLVRENASKADDVLDDLTRARVFGRVQARLGAHTAREGRRQGPARTKRTRIAWSLAFAAVTVLAFASHTRSMYPPSRASRIPARTSIISSCQRTLRCGRGSGEPPI